MAGFRYVSDEEEELEEPKDFVSLPDYRPPAEEAPAIRKPLPVSGGEDTLAQLNSFGSREPEPFRAWRGEALKRAQDADRRRDFGRDLISNVGAIFRPGKGVTWSRGASAADEFAAREKMAEAESKRDPSHPDNVLFRAIVQEASPELWSRIPPHLRSRMTREAGMSMSPLLSAVWRRYETRARTQAEAEAAKAKEEQRLKDRDEDYRRQLERDEINNAARAGRDVDPLDLELKRARLEALRQKTADAGAGGDSGLKMTAGETAKIADLDVASQTMDDLWGTFGTKAGGALAGAAQWLPATQAKQYNDERRVTAQVVGGILEGGKLTEDDFRRYYEMLPDPADSFERAKAKKEAVSRLLKTRRDIQVKTLKKAGFKTGGLSDSQGGSFDLGGVGSRPSIPTVTKPEEYNALQSGAEFIDPKGVKRRKP